MRRLIHLIFLGTFSAISCASAQPANDNFASRTPIVWPGTNVTISGTLSNATFEAGEPFLDGISSGQTAWWTWIAPSNGIVTLSIAGTGFSPLVTVYAGNDLAGLSLVASNNSLACYETTNCGCHWREHGQTSFHAVRGQAYQLVVDAPIVVDTAWVYMRLSLTNPLPAGAVINSGYPLFVGAPFGDFYVPVQTTNVYVGTFSLGLHFDPAPANDGFESPKHLTGAQKRITASNMGATKQSGEPDHLGNPGGSSVWYSWKAPAAGRVTLSINNLPPYLPPSWGSSYSVGVLLLNELFANVLPTCGAEVDQNPPPPFYPVFAAYTGTNISSLVSANGLPLGLDAYPHAIEFDVIKGQTYQLAFDGNQGTTGTIPLFLALTQPASNDNFRNRIKLRGINVVATGFNAGATPEVGEPWVSFYSSRKSVWWSWTAPVSGPVSVDVGGSDYSFPVGVFSGTSVSSLILIAADDGRVSFEAVQGRSYQIAVVDASGLTGAIKLSLRAPVVELPLVRRVSDSRQVALLSYRVAPHQIVLFQSSNDGSTWTNVRTTTAHQNTVNFIARPAPTTSGPYYRAIVVDYQ